MTSGIYLRNPKKCNADGCEVICPHGGKFCLQFHKKRYSHIRKTSPRKCSAPDCPIINQKGGIYCKKHQAKHNYAITYRSTSERNKILLSLPEQELFETITLPMLKRMNGER